MTLCSFIEDSSVLKWESTWRVQWKFSKFNLFVVNFIFGCITGYCTVNLGGLIIMMILWYSSATIVIRLCLQSDVMVLKRFVKKSSVQFGVNAAPGIQECHLFIVYFALEHRTACLRLNWSGHYLYRSIDTTWWQVGTITMKNVGCAFRHFEKKSNGKLCNVASLYGLIVQVMEELGFIVTGITSIFHSHRCTTFHICENSWWAK